MTKYLKERSYYEDRYDRLTVYLARIDMKSFLNFHDQWLEKMPNNEENKYRNPWHLNHFYMMMVGSKLVDRHDQRDQAVIDMMTEDEVRDDRIDSARLTVEPHCIHCQKVGLRITDKVFMDRKDEAGESVLFMLRCLHCEKNTACWEDGALWEHGQTRCPKCRSVMESKSRRNAKVVTTNYVCPNCKHTYQDRLDLRDAEGSTDYDYDEDRRMYCLNDEKVLKEHREGKYRFEDVIRIGKEIKEKEDNKHIYDAIKEIKILRIAELDPLLQPQLQSAGYSDFSFDKPEIARDVIVSFSCLDSRSDRNDYDSKRMLQRLVKEALSHSNWRLMSDGVSYRLGYLSGRLRAYEQEDDLKHLVMKQKNIHSK